MSRHAVKNVAAGNINFVFWFLNIFILNVPKVKISNNGNVPKPKTAMNVADERGEEMLAEVASAVKTKPQGRKPLTAPSR